MPYRDSNYPWKGNLNLNSRTLATEIQVHAKISQFITLLLKQIDSFPIHREKVSVRTIWQVAYNLTTIMEFTVQLNTCTFFKTKTKKKQENLLVLNILIPSVTLVMYL